MKDPFRCNCPPAPRPLRARRLFRALPWLFLVALVVFSLLATFAPAWLRPALLLAALFCVPLFVLSLGFRV